MNFTDTEKKLAMENGFSSPEKMKEVHDHMIEFVLPILGGNNCNVLDLGCGNGLLLKRLREKHTDIVPYGIERNTLTIESAKLLQREFRGNFIAGNMFDAETLIPRERVFDLVFLMPGRFLENANKNENKKLLHWLKTYSKHIAAYAYGDWLERYGNIENIIHDTGLKIIGKEKTDISNSVSIALCEVCE